MIEINNLTTNPVDEEFFKKTAKIVLEKENKKEADLSIALVGPGRIRVLNKKYRGENRVTDVLAFGENSKFKIQKRKRDKVERSVKMKRQPHRLSKFITGLGEIVICLREVKKNAKRYETIFEKELAKVLIHGILHLLGYEHEKSEEEAKKMRDKENYYLSQI